ncbi:MAG: hypothetical protein GX446_14350 [Chthonomonadales bacterium]|nr:hypothetical protein [Chthonomonadales bacterium]
MSQPDEDHSTDLPEDDADDFDPFVETEDDRPAGIPAASTRGGDGVSSWGCWAIALAALALLTWLGGLWKTPREPTAQERAAEAIADTVAFVEGEWESVIGDRTLALDSDGYRATLTYYDDEGNAAGQSAGHWQAGENTVHISVSGDAGSYVADLKPIEVMGCDLLVPTPVEEALLVSCYWRLQSDEGEGPDEY